MRRKVLPQVMWLKGKDMGGHSYSCSLNIWLFGECEESHRSVGTMPLSVTGSLSLVLLSIWKRSTGFQLTISWCALWDYH
jgi:hypothetical protein